VVAETVGQARHVSSDLSSQFPFNINLGGQANEVVEAGETRGPAQIFDSNRYALIGLLEILGAEAVDFGIMPDAGDELRQAFLSASAQACAILTSGGVSVSAYDLVRDIL
jgi:molybdopterin molybdotransferase